MELHQALRQIPVLARIYNDVGLLPYTFDDLQPVLVPNSVCLFRDARLELGLASRLFLSHAPHPAASAESARRH